MSETADRQVWMSLLAKAPADALATAFKALGSAPEFHWLRPPETGSVMVRGRAGGTGSAFNLGEMTVTRCALELEGGVVGHAYVQGRDKTKAMQAALVDALMQGDQAKTVRQAVLHPLEKALTEAKTARSAKAAATKVDFFTMVRGED